jgi:hypothetical protein
MLPTLPVVILRGPQDDETNPVPSSLREVCAGKVGVIDLWHTKCTRCPPGLEKFNEAAVGIDTTRVMFIACALSQGSGNIDAVSDYIEE